VSATSIYFESLPYRVNEKTGLIDYDALEATALVYRPKLIVCGASAYPRDWDYLRLRQIADKVEALLMCDMAHISGLVASQVVNDPFPHCHLVTTTTHKSLRGPRAGIIFFRKDTDHKLEEKVNFSVLPSIQGGPHDNTIAAIAVQLKEVQTPAFIAYAKQIKANAAALAEFLVKKEQKLVTGGTDNHLLLWDLRPHNITGNKFEALCDACSITLNKNSIYGDVNAFAPGGVRIGTPALTSRGFTTKDFVQVGEFLCRALTIALELNRSDPKMKLDPFKALIKGNTQIQQLRDEVETFAKQFPIPGFDISTLKYKN